MPNPTENNIKDNVNGSLTAVLNLTTDKAPTNPRDNASEDLTTAIKLATETVTISNVFP